MNTNFKTELSINIDFVKENLNKIKSILSEKIELMPVLKSDGYGTHLTKIPELFSNLKIKNIAVAIVQEGIYLRKKGYTDNIVLLSPSFYDEVEDIIKYELTPNACDFNLLKKLNKAAIFHDKVVNVHIEIDTGMGRNGIKPKELKYFCSNIEKLDKIKIEGIFTHFSSSSDNDEYTKKQIKSFNETLRTVDILTKKIKYIHACNSGGILNHQDAHYNMVRPGIMIFGYHYRSEMKKKIKLSPATILTSKICFINKIDKGEYSGYDRKYKAANKTIIAIITFGSADGLSGYEANKSYVVINKKIAKIIGICMNNIMIDITNIENVKVGTKVYFWDNEIITLDNVAGWNKTSKYIIFSNLSNRVSRKFI